VPRWINSLSIDAAGGEAALGCFVQTDNFNIKYMGPTQTANKVLMLPNMMFTRFALKAKATA